MFDSPTSKSAQGLHREHCWRCATTLIAIENHVRPLDCIAHANPAG